MCIVRIKGTEEHKSLGGEKSKITEQEEVMAKYEGTIIEREKTVIERATWSR